MVIAYLDSCGKNISMEKQRQVIEQYAGGVGCAVDVFFSGNDIRKLADNFQAGEHVLLLADIVCLGCRFETIMKNLRILSAKNFKVISIKENFIIEPGQKSESLFDAMDAVQRLRRSMLSVVTRNALDKKRLSGCKLGRREGYRNKKYVWSDKEEELKKLLLQKCSKAEISRRLNISVGTIYGFIRKKKFNYREVEK